MSGSSALCADLGVGVVGSAAKRIKEEVDCAGFLKMLMAEPDLCPGVSGRMETAWDTPSSGTDWDGNLRCLWHVGHTELMRDVISNLILSMMLCDSVDDRLKDFASADVLASPGYKVVFVFGASRVVP